MPPVLVLLFLHAKLKLQSPHKLPLHAVQLWKSQTGQVRPCLVGVRVAEVSLISQHSIAHLLIEVLVTKNETNDKGTPLGSTSHHDLIAHLESVDVEQCDESDAVRHLGDP